ncbi:MAG: thioredoxin domain-containing protein [Candidatus Paceibacterota bacterium]
MNGQEQQLTKQEKRELKRQEKDARRTNQERKRKTRKFLSWSAGIAMAFLIIGGIVYLIQNSTPTNPEQAASLLEVKDNDWTTGSPGAPITLIEYSDLQCPACGAYHPILKQLIEEFGSDITFVYRHFPLRQIHPNADLAARATEAAGAQGKFWEMHDMLFENQRSWSNDRDTKELFVSYAESLGLGVDQFKSDLASKGVKAKVDANYKSGLGLGVNATPTFFLNGQKLQNPRSHEEFKTIIQNAISQP